MATYSPSNAAASTPIWQQQMQFPYSGNGMLMNNTPYDNYMGSRANAQQPFVQQQNNQFLKCRPVSSKEEARAYQIDLDGSY